MNKDLNFLKKEIKLQEIKVLENDKDRVFDNLVKNQIAFTAFRETSNFFVGDKNFIVDLVIASEYNQECLLKENDCLFVYRIRYITL